MLYQFNLNIPVLVLKQIHIQPTVLQPFLFFACVLRESNTFCNNGVIGPKSNVNLEVRACSAEHLLYAGESLCFFLNVFFSALFTILCPVPVQTQQ